MLQELIENYMDEVWNKKNVSAIDKLFSEDVIIHSPLGTYSDRQSMVDTVETWIQALPDMQVEFEHTLEKDGVVISHWSAKGTHQKELLGVKPSGKHVSYQGVTIYRFKEGKVIEYWAYLDSLALKEKLNGV